MSESYLQRAFARRIGGEKFGKDTKIYKFEKIKRAKREAMAKNPGVSLIDMGVGEPDDMAFPCVIEAMKNEVAKWENRTYADNGVQEFKAKLDADEYGGAPLLGISKVVIKAHGSSGAKAIKNAVRQAVTCCENGMVDAIRENIHR